MELLRNILLAIIRSKPLRLKNIFLSLLFLCCLVNFQPVDAQTCLDVLKNNALYSNSNVIINGRKWVNETGYAGSPMLEENYWPKANILYNGIRFSDIHMNYDLYKDELIVYYPEKSQERYIVINKDHLGEFSFADSLIHRDRLFKYIELPDAGKKVLCEKIPAGKASLFIKQIKTVEATPSENTKGKYLTLYKYYFDAGSGFYSFRSKSQLIKLLTDHKTEMNKFIRKKNLKINQKHPEDIVTAIRYYDGLK